MSTREVTIPQTQFGIAAQSLPGEDVFGFLLGPKGGLSSRALVVPKIRDYIEDRPETMTTFRARDIDGLNPHRVDDRMVEFAGSWAVPDVHTGKKVKSFVNPNSPHAKQYSDTIVQCACGTRLMSTHRPIDDDEPHADDCMTYNRLRARAALAERRHSLLVQMRLIGWSVRDVGARMGVCRSRAGDMVKEFRVDWDGLHDEYKRRSRNTYDHLVYEKGEDASLVADVLGHRRTTFERWLGNYG